MRNKASCSFTDVVIGAGLVLLICVVSVNAVSGVRDAANRVKCKGNLHQIGLAILLYQNDNQQQFPETVQDNTGTPVPVWGTPYQADKKLGPVAKASAFDGGKAAPAVNDVRASLFLLLSDEKVDPKVFICPSTELKAWDLGGKGHTAKEWTNWQGDDGLAQHLSYSLQNPFIANAALATGFSLRRLDKTFAVAADMNPGGDAETKVTLKSPATEITAANSLNHGGDEQNVLFGDGHTDFVVTPFCGTQHDNIYTAFGPEISDPGRKAAVILSSSYDPTDSILLPTAADIGYKAPKK